MITTTRMDTVQLTYSLWKDKYTQAAFQGVYPLNKLTNRIVSYAALIIANVDTSEKPGSHWVAFYFTQDREAEFFDSYGLPPSDYTRTFTAFLNSNASSWTFNSVTLQSENSQVCGHYCLYYSFFRCRNVSLSTIIHRFSKNKYRNDFLVKRFIEKMFPLILRKYHGNHVNKQV